LPATFAVATAFVAERRPLYNDVVEFAVQRCAHQRVRLQLTDGEREFRLGDYAGRLELYDWVMYECIRMDQSQRDAFLAEVLEELDVAADAEVMFENPDYRPLTPAQVRQMAASDLVEIASHSVNHYLLSSADAPTKRFELRESKRVLEAMTGAPCTAFCVPGGKYDREMVEEAYAAGYQAVLCSDVGTAVRGQRVLKRNGVFRQPDLHWFADVVRGPVHELVRAAGRARAKFKAG
jgi:peptidoglycan/xylan/chitin deacetylase (PgdA/CDA1 family)